MDTDDPNYGHCNRVFQIPAQCGGWRKSSSAVVVQGHPGNNGYLPGGGQRQVRRPRSLLAGIPWFRLDSGGNPLAAVDLGGDALDRGLGVDVGAGNRDRGRLLAELELPSLGLENIQLLDVRGLCPDGAGQKTDWWLIDNL